MNGDKVTMKNGSLSSLPSSSEIKPPFVFLSHTNKGVMRDTDQIHESTASSIFTLSIASTVCLL